MKDKVVLVQPQIERVLRPRRACFRFGRQDHFTRPSLSTLQRGLIRGNSSRTVRRSAGLLSHKLVYASARTLTSIEGLWVLSAGHVEANTQSIS